MLRGAGRGHRVKNRFRKVRVEVEAVFFEAQDFGNLLVRSKRTDARGLLLVEPSFVGPMREPWANAALPEPDRLFVAATSRIRAARRDVKLRSLRFGARFHQSRHRRSLQLDINAADLSARSSDA